MLFVRGQNRTAVLLTSQTQNGALERLMDTCALVSVHTVLTARNGWHEQEWWD